MSSTTTTSTTSTLRDSDVVCGRGGLANKHPGNRMFRRIVGENKSIYQRSLNPSHKQLLVVSIVMAIQQHGGRFVKRASSSSSDNINNNINNNWIEISEKEAKHKTAQALRELDNSSDHSRSSSRSSSPVPILTAPVSSNDTIKKSATTTTTTTTVLPPKLIKSSLDVIPLSLEEADTTMTDVTVDGFEELLMDLLPQEDEPTQSSTTSSISDNDCEMFDLIPLDDADHFAFENNPEYHDLCSGLFSVLSAC